MKVAVIGSGEMGRGIALVFAQYGNEVFLNDTIPEALNNAEKYIEKNIEKMTERGIIKNGEGDEIKSRIKFIGALEESVKDAEIVIEAIPEIVELKQKLFSSLDKLTKEDAILATNTSNIKISEISKEVSNKERVLGMHFFNPANRLKLVEIIRSDLTGKDYFEKAVGIAESIGKTAIRVLKDSPGFIVNRINAPGIMLFCSIIDMDMERPEELDAYAKAQGLPMGPYELMDFVGIDTVTHSLDYFSRTLSDDYGKCKILRTLVKEGKLGKKTGQGFYDWSSGRAAIPKADASEKITIMDLFAIEINEAVKLIEEQVGLPEDIETGVKLGMNRPFGPISVAQSLTNTELKNKLEELSKTFEIETFKPAKSIMEGKLKDVISLKSFPEVQRVEASPKEGAMDEDRGSIYKTLIFEKRQNHVARILLNRPKHNLINSDFMNDFENVLKELWEDKEIRVIIVTGSGETLSAGAELSQFIPSPFDFTEYSRKGERIFKMLQEIPKVVIAEMKGYALGGGLELSLSCDIRVSTPECQMGFPEVTLGLIPAWSGSQRLSKLIGASRALYLILTGKRINGEEGKNVGLISELFPKDSIDQETIKFAENISLSTAPIAAVLSKRLINRGSEISYDSGLEMEAMAAGIVYATDDLKEGVSALLSKRKPDFKGK